METSTVVSNCLQELIDKFEFEDWTKANFTKIIQNRCPGNYTIEDDPGGICRFRIKFSCDSDRAWFYLRYMGK